MRYLDVGASTRISRIGLGTWQFGSREWGYGPTYAGQEARAIVRRALELGVTLFDTAEIYGLGHRPANRVRLANPLFLPENLERASHLLAVLREVADAHAATPAQVALAWVILRPGVVAIPGASSLAQVESNAAAADLDLTDDEYQALSTAADRFRPITGPAALPRLLRARFT